MQVVRIAAGKAVLAIATIGLSAQTRYTFAIAPGEESLEPLLSRLSGPADREFLNERWGRPARRVDRMAGMDTLFNPGSYLAITVVLILTGAGLPVPEEVPIIAAGVMAGHGRLEPWLAWGSCLLGALVGDLVMYGIGHHFGRGLVRHPYWLHFVTPEREARIEQMIQRHGLKALLVARFLVGLRSPVYLTAGILRMPLRRFFLIDLFCATGVVTTFFLLSYFFGPTIVFWIRRMEILLTVGVVLVATAVGVFLWRRFCRQKEQQTGAVGSVQPEAWEELGKHPLEEPEQVL